MIFNQPSSQALQNVRYVLMPILVLATIVIIGVYFIESGKQLMEEQVRERLRSTAAIASLQFDPALIAAIHTKKDINTAQYRTVVHVLNQLRDNVPGIRYAYIMRKTKVPSIFEFVADADSFTPVSKLDLNHNGVLDPDEAPGSPGDSYNASDSPALVDGFNGPTVDAAISKDKWGTFISAYAPIRSSNGDAIAVIGFDMDAQKFTALTQSIVSPVAFFLVSIVSVFITAYVIVVIRRRRLDAMEELETERTALLDLATHQLGMPLATFKWWLEILRESEGGKFCQKNGICDELQEGITRMDQIIGSLHAAAHLQNNQLAYRATKVSVATLMRDVEKDMHALYRRRKQTLVFEIAPSLPALLIDRKLLQGVMKELLDNASVYSPEKSIVTVRVRKNLSRMVIDVEDHGCGISRQDQNRIFSKLTRGKNAMLHKPVGNGVGLYIAKGILERAGGTISVRSDLGKGSTFSILLPLS